MSSTTFTPQSSPAKLPLAVVLAAVVVALLNLPGQNGLLTTISLTILLAGAAMLWRPGEPPICLFIFGYQWLQASISAFHANWLGIDVAAYTIYGGENGLAVLLTLIGLLALAAGMRLGAGPVNPDLTHSARAMALSQPIRIWFWLYVLSAILAIVALWVAAIVPGLSQPLLALAGLKWAFFLIFAYASFVRNQLGSPLFAAAFLVELVVSTGGYFSDFKTVMYFTLFAVIMAGVRMRTRHVIGASTLVALIIASGIVWTAVKERYRDVASSGAESQAITLDLGDRLTKLVQLTSDLDGEAISDATEKMIHRISYVELFGVVLVRIPQVMPYEEGANLLDAVSRPFMPRLLFADKSEINDTVRASNYTGGLSGTYPGTSISLGYMADLYIDFGPYFMMSVIFALGYLYGRTYRLLANMRKCGPLVGFACACAIFAQAALLEVSLAKLVGGLVVSVLITLLFIALVVPRLSPWLVENRRLNA